MADREKLIDILCMAHEAYYADYDPSKTYIDVLADYLVANGVTIPASEQPKGET